MVYRSTLKGERGGNCVRYYIFCERNFSRGQPLCFIIDIIGEITFFCFIIFKDKPVENIKTTMEWNMEYGYGIQNYHRSIK